MPDNTINLESDILLVDDEVSNLKLLTQVLSEAGYTSLRSARRPKLAIDSALVQPPNLILLDVRMPEMDGFEVCRRLKQEERTRDIPIIFVSALQNMEDRVQGFEAGGVDFIAKPFQAREVLARVRTHLILRNLQLSLEDLVDQRTSELAVEVTERKNAEEILAQSEERLRTLFEHANDGILTLEGDRITDCNQRALEILKRPREEIVGHDPSAFSPTRQPDGKPSAAKVQVLVKRAYDGEPLIFDWVCIRGDGAKVDLEVSLNKVDIGQKPTLLALWRDITRRKYMEAERRRANLELKQAYDEIRQLKDRLEVENLTLREEIKVSVKQNELVGKSHGIRTVLQQVEHVAPTDSTVLILGETGTGKGLIARQIHELSARRDRPLVNVNCAALPATLIESEFFGHEKGAFTGAIDHKIGRFEMADGGTIFLDEIGDLPIELQAKLLRVLHDQEFERIGSSQTKTVDTRVIAATNRDLDLLIEQGAFRADLYYRLGVFPIRIPPLRERRSDIPLLVWFFIMRMQSRLGRTIHDVPDRVMDALTAYDWPGNVREIRNIVERAMILSPGTALELGAGLLPKSGVQRSVVQAHKPKRESLQDVERDHILSVLEASNWKVRGKDGAAERLGLKRTTLQSRMKKLGIKRPSL
ncbi:MAG: sigma 54-interacting transcriptional regulator [Desulfobacterales bacterium]|nr:sigma 54-interacting transcriptional regulator [Desulfobacterales bacterium]MDJ0884572.1 sigma 54-interacting transcriptional regulator [Desulfobacterales bacterium]